MCILESDRLILRPPRPVDIAAMVVWLGDYNVSKNLARVPFPYDEQDAEAFVAGIGRSVDNHTFVILRKSDGLFWAVSGCIRRMTVLSSAIGWARPSGARAMPPRRHAGW